ncbi:MAG: carbamoyltransferase [Nitrospira sp.]|nr:carbamoyltransferase [Nitrospira sp.]
MYIVGLAGLLIDGAACVVDPRGRVIAAVEEERPSRVKHASMRFAGGLPYGSLELCFRAAGIGWDQVDHVGYFFQPWREFYRMSAFRLRKAWPAPSVAAYYGVHHLDSLRGHLAVPRFLSLQKGYRAQFHNLSHHLTHAASTFYVSPYESAAILILDAMSERESISFFMGEGTRIKLLKRVNFPHSWGFLYSLFTQYLGFRPNSDEYKVMGLAAYGKPTFLAEILRMIRLQATGEPSLDWSYFDSAFRGPRYVSDKFYRTFGPPRHKDEPVTERHQDLAASIQKALEISVLSLAKDLHRLTRAKRLCVAGGVGLNCLMNSRLLLEGPFSEVYVPPSPHDAGCAIGAALLIAHQIRGLPREYVMTPASLGPEYSDAEVRAVLESCKVRFSQSEDIEADVADLIAQGNIVGWFQGRMEWGPRALGQRSILADPTRPGMKDRVNAVVKFREDFRPFAPAVLAEAAGDYFLDIKESPFMLFVARVRPEHASTIPAVLHVDGTARLQTVDRTLAPRFWRLIRAFADRRGVPMVLNTSFNVQGEPIVATPRDAVRCFFSCGLDALGIGNYLVRKREN